MCSPIAVAIGYLPSFEHIAGADDWLFMAVILYVIVQIVKRGIEIKNENNLTI